MVPATSALRAFVTSTPSSSARQTFPSGLTPAVKDCFGLHGHYAFGFVAKEESGVGGMDATCGGHITDLVYWLQAGKIVDVRRTASDVNRLASAFRTASVASLPAAGRLPAAAGHRAAVSDCDDSAIGSGNVRVFYLRMYCSTIGDCAIAVHLLYRRIMHCCSTLPICYTAIGDIETFDDSRLRRNFASVQCEGRCWPSVVEHSLRAEASSRCEGGKMVSYPY